MEVGMFAEDAKFVGGGKVMKPPIPRERQEDVLHMYWVLLGALESRCQPTDILDKAAVESGYNILNQIGYCKHRPSWESTKEPTKLSSQT